VDDVVCVDGRVNLVGIAVAAQADGPLVKQLSRVDRTDGRRGDSALPADATALPQAGNVRGAGSAARAEPRGCRHEKDHAQARVSVRGLPVWTPRLPSANVPAAVAPGFVEKN